MKAVVKIMVMAVLTALISSCGKHVVASAEHPTPPASAVLSEEDRQRFDHFFLEALCQQEKGNYTDAFEMLSHCLAIDSTSAEVYFLLSSYYADLKKDSLTMVYMKRAAELNPDNNFYLERFGQSLLNIGEYDQAVDIYERLYANNRHRTDVLELLLKIYEYNKNHKMMIDVLNRMELVDGSSEQLTLNKMHVYALQGKKEEEFNELKGLTERNPYDLNYRVMLGNWMVQNERGDEALSLFKEVLDAEPDNLSAQLSLADYYKSVGQDSIADTMIEQILIDKKTPSDTKLSLIRQIIMENQQHGGDSTVVLNLFDRILATPQTNADIAEIKVAYMFLCNMPKEDIRKALQDVLAIAPDNVTARIQLLQNIWETENYEEIIRLAQAGTEYNPDEMVFYYFLGMAYYQTDEHDEALDALRRGVSQINEKSNKEFVSDFYAIMGDILHEKGQNKQAFEAYDSCLVWKADNYGALNNYAYYLSELGQDLARAEQMSFKTIKAEPENPIYLDTYAWILFMEEKYEEAKVYIDQALANDSTLSSVYFEHAGDIYSKTGDTGKAVEFWKKALEQDKENALLRKKIKLKKYVKK